MKNMGGRPKKVQSEKRSFVIKFSCTQDEYQFLKYHAKSAGYVQLANFLHSVVFEVVKNGRFRYIDPVNFDRDFTYQLSKLSNNINQALVILHESDEPTHSQFEYFNDELTTALRIIEKSILFAYTGLEKEAQLSGVAIRNGYS